MGIAAAATPPFVDQTRDSRNLVKNNTLTIQSLSICLYTYDAAIIASGMVVKTNVRKVWSPKINWHLSLACPMRHSGRQDRCTWAILDVAEYIEVAISLYIDLDSTYTIINFAAQRGDIFGHADSFYT